MTMFNVPELLGVPPAAARRGRAGSAAWRPRIRRLAWPAALPVLCAFALLLGAAPVRAQTPRPTMPDSVREYVREAMALFRARSVHRDTVDWRALEDSVLARAAGARSPADTWLPLAWAFRSVDRHSFLSPPESMLGAVTGGLVPRPAQPVDRPPLGERVADGIALVRVPAHAGVNRPAYVDSLRTQLEAFDGEGVCGWIVDLRDNTGGNMWPMLAGIGPLLGAERVGSFTTDPPGAGWRYRDGRSWLGDSLATGSPLGWGSQPPRPLRHGDAPVAVLVGPQTASSGEMVLIAFLGRPELRTFGEATAGYASANSSVPLRDGATLIVTSSYPLDRFGRAYPLSIAPDEVVAAGADAVARAAAWLQGRDACAPRRMDVDFSGSRSTTWWVKQGRLPESDRGDQADAKR